MTNSEFSNTFSTLLNSYSTESQFGEGASKKEIVLDEYEKSVLLTIAQDIVVKSFFDSKSNSVGEGFDDSTRRQVDFSSLIKVVTLNQSTGSTSSFDNRGIMYDLPKKEGKTGASSAEVLFILNEKLMYVPSGNGITKEFVIVPINYKEYDREMSKPYGQPLKKQAWRLFQNNAVGFDLKTELIPRLDYKKAVERGEGSFIYKIRYVKRPRPIILETLPEDLEIEGESQESSCELNPVIHMDILNKAVELAIASRGTSNANAQVQQNPQYRQ